MLRPEDGIYGLQASLLKTLASPRRLEIVHYLGEFGCVEVRKLAEHFGSTQPAISQHLAALRRDTDERTPEELRADAGQHNTKDATEISGYAQLSRIDRYGGARAA